MGAIGERFVDGWMGCRPGEWSDLRNVMDGQQILDEGQLRLGPREKEGSFGKDVGWGGRLRLWSCVRKERNDWRMRAEQKSAKKYSKREEEGGG